MDPLEKTSTSEVDLTSEDFAAHVNSYLSNDTLPHGYADWPEIDSSAWYNAPFSWEEYVKVVKRIPRNKAPGIDRISNDILKDNHAIIGRNILDLINKCLERRELPADWKISKLIMLYKGKGTPEDPNNYRGIALLPNILKILTSLINNRLTENCFHLLPKNQYGFRKARNTQILVNILLTEAKETIAGKNKLYTVFLDYTKAFDSVPRDRLLEKLKSRFGVKGKILRLICKIFGPNKIRVYDNICLAKAVTQKIGVLQGDSLSPSLFIMYTADMLSHLNEHLKEVTTLAYADDVAIFSRSRTHIQDALNIIADWNEENKLELNTKKTKVIKFRNGGRLCKADILEYCGEEIEFVNEFRYLGITLTPKISFTKHIQNLKNKSASAMSTIRRLQLVSLNTGLRIYAIKIRPIINYCIMSVDLFR